MLKMQLLTLMLCIAHVVYSADFGWHDGFIPDGTNSGANYYEDTATVQGDGINIDTTNTFNIFSDSVTNFYICDYGYIVPGGTVGSCEDRNTAGFDARADIPIVAGKPTIAAHYFGTADAAITESIFTARQIKWDEQLSTISPGDEIAIGADVNTLKLLAVYIDDCNQDARRTTVVVEAIVVTWTQSDGTDTLTYQVAVVYTSDGDTYVIMVFKDAANNFNTLGLPLFVTSATAGEFAESCVTAAITDLSLYSNCQCAHTPGVYIFNTTDAAASCSSTTQCADTENWVDDTQNLEANCREPVVPQGTCKASYYCQVTRLDRTRYALNIILEDNPFDEYTFIDPSVLPVIQDIAIVPTFCDGFITSNVTAVVQISDSFTTAPSPCVITRGTEIDFALWFWKTGERNITQDGSHIINGTCDTSQLLLNVSDSLEFESVFSTAVPKRTPTMTSGITNQRGGSGARLITDADEQYPGQYLFIYTCFNRDDDFNENADAYGHYTVSCDWSADQDFLDEKRTIRGFVDGTGCANSALKYSAAYVQSAFVYDADFTTDQNYDWCQVSGGFKAFKWIGTDYLYYQCYTHVCKNMDIMADSKCVDSCTNTRINLRKKRQADDDTIVLTGRIKIGSNYTSTSSSSSGKKCVDQTTAVATLSGLISALVIATGVAVVLFVKVQQRKRV